MTWLALSAEVSSLFAGYTSRADDYQRSLEEWGAWRIARAAERIATPFDREKRRAYQRQYRAARPDVRAKNVVRMHQWRQVNRERARELSREHNRRQRERAKTDPVYREKFLAMKAAAQRRQRAKYRDEYRIAARKRQQAFRARRREVGKVAA